MGFWQKVLLGGVLFSWLMVFLAWRFTYPIEIMADWVLLALVLSAIYGFILHRGRVRKSFADPEALA